MAIRNSLIPGATGIAILTVGLLLGIPREAPAPPITAVQVINTLHAITVNDVGTFPNGLALAVASQQVQFYADGGTNVRLQVVRGTTTGAASARVTLSGYLVNVP